MAKKLKCDPNMMPSWMKNAKNCQSLEPNSNKVTLAQQKKAVSMTINNPDGCIPKPKGGGGGARTKELGEYYREVQKKTGKKWKDIPY